MLDQFPRTRLGHLPTPLEPMSRLSDHLGGPQIWIKRDDCTGLGFGGNKTRKLEFLVGAAQAEGADTLITFGALQSNHARQTAAAAARVGLACELILVEQVQPDGPAYDASGNVLLDYLFDATVHRVADDDKAAKVLFERLSVLEDAGRKAYVIPPGGSTATGTLGYVVAGQELADQLGGQGGQSATVITASSTGGTQVGLALGLAGSGHQLLGVNVYADDEAAQYEKMQALLTETADMIGADHDPGMLTMIPGWLGDGYGLPNEGVMEAISLMASLEGILIDPVYTGKAMAALIAKARSGDWSEDDMIVFIHTGGAPGLFAYQKSLEVTQS